MAIFNASNPEHVKISEEYQKLDEEVINLQKRCQDAVINGASESEILIIERDYYSKIIEWREYLDQHSDILLAHRQH